MERNDSLPTGDYHLSPVLSRKIVVGDPIDGFSISIGQSMAGGLVDRIFKDDVFFQNTGKTRVLVWLELRDGRKSLWKEFIDIPISFEYDIYQTNQ